LIAAIPKPGLADSRILGAQSGRRRLSATVPALVTLCRRFAGFDPSEDVIDAVSSIADCLTGSSLALADAAPNGPENVDDHRAITIAGAIRRLRLSPRNSTSGRADIHIIDAT